MKRIVLTGGPCAGKSTALAALKAAFGEKIVCLPEAATMLLSSGFPLPGRDLPHSPAWQGYFQSTICSLQVNLEGAYGLVAGQQQAELLVCDRGLLDGAAYTPRGVPAFLAAYNLDLKETYARYVRVIHLESLATGCPELYGKAGNQNRYESLEEAVALEGRTRAAWNGHPDWNFVPAEGGIERVVAKVIGLVGACLAGETETSRKAA